MMPYLNHSTTETNWNWICSSICSLFATRLRKWGSRESRVPGLESSSEEGRAKRAHRRLEAELPRGCGGSALTPLTSSAFSRYEAHRAVTITQRARTLQACTVPVWELPFSFVSWKLFCPPPVTTSSTGNRKKKLSWKTKVSWPPVPISSFSGKGGEWVV